jgi:hypothetical protein
MTERFGMVATLEWQPLLERAAEAQRVSQLLQLEARALRRDSAVSGAVAGAIRQRPRRFARGSSERRTQADVRLTPYQGQD